MYVSVKIRFNIFGLWMILNKRSLCFHNIYDDGLFVPLLGYL